MPSRGVGAFEMLESVSPSSSTPNDNLPLPATLRFFLKRGLGVDALYFTNQMHKMTQWAQSLTRLKV